MPNTLPPMLQSLLTDGALFIDNTTLSSWVECGRQFKYKHIDKRILAREKAALAFGGAVHEGLAMRYAEDPNLEKGITLRIMEDTFQSSLAKTPLPDEEYRNIDYGIELLRQYNNYYPTEDFTVRNVELPFAVRLADIALYEFSNYEVIIPVIYTGRIDILIEKDSQLWVVDHKTSSVFGDSLFSDMAVSPQQDGYCWSVESALGLKPIGYMINAIATRKPTKSGKGIEFQRQWTYVEKERRDEWRANTILRIEEILWHMTNETVPANKKWCVGKYGKCAFYDVCALPAAQRPIMLDTDIYKKNEWSPLAKLRD